MHPYIVSPPHRYAKVIDNSKRIRWDIDRDVIRGREFDFGKGFLPAGMSLVDELQFLTGAEARLLTQVQGRSYANLFGLVERFIGAKMAELGSGYALGDQTAMEALVRFTDEELKHQALFRRMDQMIARGMPDGYRLVAEPSAVAAAVLSKTTWAVLALICHIELFTQAHYRASIEHDAGICPLWKDVFLHHWLEESQHAVLDELEWQREDGQLDEAQRDAAVDDLIDLMGAVDSILQGQAAADADWFIAMARRSFASTEVQRVRTTVLKAYRWQYIVSGVVDPRFQKVLGGLVSRPQMQRIQSALSPLMDAMPEPQRERTPA
jgi:hypothetical protein